MPGFSAPEIHKKLSLRASVTSELVLQDVRVPEKNRLPDVSSLRGPLSCLNEARFGIVFGAVGSGRACFESALEYAKERIVLGKPLAGLPEAWLNLIHVDDAATAVPAAADAETPPGLVLVADVQPVQRGNHSTWLADPVGAPPTLV